MHVLKYEVEPMNDELLKIIKDIEKSNNNEPLDITFLFPGIGLSYLSLASNSFSVQHKHSAMENIMQINYCKSGQMEWKMKNGNYIFLNPGDFSLHTMKSCTDSLVSFPAGQYSGLTIYIDLQEASVCPPELLKDTSIFDKVLRKGICPDDTISFLAGNEQTESIFSAFYDQPENVKLSYQKIKVLELLLYLIKFDFTPQKQLTAYQSEQIDIIREIHDSLTERMGERITIEELSKQYLINPTTLKTAFKSVYGNSIAAHIKEHRMEQAAKMLRESNLSISEIAQAVGYDSQSKFTATFKTFFGVLPREYKKNHK